MSSWYVDVKRINENTKSKRLTYEWADSDDEEDVSAMITIEADIGDLSYRDATTGKNAKLWKESIKQEYDALQENETWTLTPAPRYRKVTPCRWVFKIELAPRAEERI